MTGPFQLNANRLSDRIELKSASLALASRLAFSAAVMGAMTGAALAQPVLTPLTGTNSTPTGLSNPQGGIYYISAPTGRWSLNHGSLTFSGITSGGGGKLSADGSHQTSAVLNNSPQIFGNTATGVSPPFSTTPTLVASTSFPAATELCAARYDWSASTFQRQGGLPIVPDLMVYGSGSSGGSSSIFESPNAISATGRFVVGNGYVSTYNSAAGTTISDNTFRIRPWIWDAQANAGAGAFTVLPTSFYTSGSGTWRRRQGTALAVSSDGLVVLGAQEYTTVGTSTNPDPDTARLVVYRWNGSAYMMSYLPNGVTAGGFPQSNLGLAASGRAYMNPAGTVIVGPATTDAGTSYVGRWVWNAGTSSWNSPINLGANINPTLTITTIDDAAGVTVNTSGPHGLNVNDPVFIAGDSIGAYNGLWQITSSENSTSFTINALPNGTGTGGTVNKEASWLPSYVRTCQGTFISMAVTGMSDDGNTIVGSMSYNASACDFTHTPATAGWIWTTATGYMEDWYDHLRAQGVAGLGFGEPFGPQGDSAPLLGGPTAISPDGTTFTGWVGAPTVGAQAWVLTPRGCGTADFNCDGDTGTDADIEAFFACLAGACPGAPCNSTADFNADGDTGTDADIEAFFRVLAGGNC